MSWWIRILYSLELMKSGTSIEGSGFGMMFAEREREREREVVATFRCDRTSLSTEGGELFR